MKSALFALALFLGLAGPSAAQPYPNKPIKVIVPYPAGGNADITARVVSRKMSDILGVPVVVENRAGANGMIGTDIVAKSVPDGYTLIAPASGPIVINPVLYSKVPYDSVKDLQPISQLTSFQYVLIVPAASPIKSIQDLVAQGKAQPGKLSYGSTGIGGGGHLAGEMFALLSGAQFNHIPYKGSAPALVDLLGGQLSFTFDTVSTSTPLIAEKRVRAFAVSGPRRASSLPDVPTMAELGFKDFDVTQFISLLAPAKTDPAIIKKLQEAVALALKDPDVIQNLQVKGGNDLVGSTPEAFAELIQKELKMYGALIKKANIKQE